MLSPCSTKDKFIIMELCDDIRIDTVQLAKYEFFSGVFRTITISVSQTYTSDTEGWVQMGTYDAKNVRSVQVTIYSLCLLLLELSLAVVSPYIGTSPILQIRPDRLSLSLR